MLGAPGSGKSTHAARLAEHLGAAHLNLGSLFREVAAGDSAFGREIGGLVADGKLVPDVIAHQVIRERLEALAPGEGFVLEGYPRNAAQAESLERLFGDLGLLEPRPVVVRLDTSREELLRRLRARRDTEDRSDDTDEAIARRLEIYDMTTTPVSDLVEKWATVVPIDGDQSLDAVGQDIEAAVERLS